MKSCLDIVLVATVAIELIVMAKSAIEGDLCPCYLSLFLHQPPADAISHLALLFPHEVVVSGNQGQVIRMLNRKKTGTRAMNRCNGLVNQIVTILIKTVL